MKWLEVDRAITYAILSKVWSLFAGPVTLLMISFYLSPEIQGFYYTFLSLLALQSFIELGFYIVVTQFASHEWAHLDLNANGEISGDETALSRLISLGRLVFKWYGGASAIFITTVGFAGYVFLSQQPAPGIEWEIPWLALVVIAGLQLWAMPFLSLLEGCNQVTTVYLFRFVQAIVSSLSAWLVMFMEGGLWLAAASSGAALLCGLYLLLIRYRKFFNPFFKKELTSLINWKTEMWPMQWRLAVGGILNYFLVSIYTPVLFHYHGPIPAGKMGMTWSIMMTLMALAMAWVSTKVPRFGVLIAKKNYIELDRLFFRTSIASLIVIGLGAILIWLIIYGLNFIQHSLANRLLAPLPAFLFLVGMVLGQVSQCQSAYLRAHKKEPFLVLSIIYSLVNGLLVWGLGRQWGVMGMAIGYLSAMSLVCVPMGTVIWYQCRLKWHLKN